MGRTILVTLTKPVRATGPVTALGLLDEIAIQPIVLIDVHRGRLPTVLSRRGSCAFNLQIRCGI